MPDMVWLCDHRAKKTPVNLSHFIASDTPPSAGMQPPIERRKNKRAATDERPKCGRCEKDASKCLVCKKNWGPFCFDHTGYSRGGPFRPRVCDNCQEKRLFWCHGCNSETFNRTSCNAWTKPIEIEANVPDLPPLPETVIDQNKEVDIESSKDESSEGKESIRKGNYPFTLCENCAEGKLCESFKENQTFTCNLCDEEVKGDCHYIVVTDKGTVLKEREEDEDTNEADRKLQPGQRLIKICRYCKEGCEMGELDY